MMTTSQNKRKEIECSDAMPVPPLLVKEQLFDVVEAHLALSKDNETFSHEADGESTNERTSTKLTTHVDILPQPMCKQLININ